ncbi:MAG: hypothetical protein K2O14_13285 [Oscillospiraceae bacterium]|nr:hypothetical protein [Oscillospiraceae bacterium]
MNKYYFDRNDGNVYELPSIEEALARAEDEFSFNEDKYMENWRERQEADEQI